MDVIALLEDMISRPSENPPGDERELASYLVELLGSWSVPVTIVAGEERRPNVIARIYGGPGPRLILQGHLDTKPARHSESEISRWSTDPFRATRKDGFVYGLGACDVKGGLAAVLAALHGLVSSDARWSGELVFQGVADEENGSMHGAELLLARGLLHADAALVTEPTDMMITTAQLGNSWVEVSISGRAAHAGTPWQGIDAVECGLQLVTRMKDALRERAIDPRFRGHPRLNVGRITGGDHPGTVPGTCHMLLDTRVRPGERREDYLELYRGCARALEHETGASIRLSPHRGGGCEANEVPEDHPWIRQLCAAWEATALGPAPLGVFPGGSDARFFARAGVPAVVFGPGCLEHAHAVDERVREQDVVRSARFLTDAVARFLA